MIVVKSDNLCFIEVSCIARRNEVPRFPNRLIWDINSFLSEKFYLYEYFPTKQCGENCICISNNIFAKKYLCFSELHFSYISLVGYDENEYRDEYEKHRNEVHSFDEFVEIYSMESVDDLDYIATENISDTIRKLEVTLKNRCLLRDRDISKALNQVSRVSIHLGDQNYMMIQSEDSVLLCALLDIIKTYERF